MRAALGHDDRRVLWQVRRSRTRDQEVERVVGAVEARAVERRVEALKLVLLARVVRHRDELGRIELIVELQIGTTACGDRVTLSIGP